MNMKRGAALWGAKGAFRGLLILPLSVKWPLNGGGNKDVQGPRK